MPRLTKAALTERLVVAMSVPSIDGKDRFYWDADVRGFGLRVSGRSGDGTYVLQYRNADGATRRMVLGKASVLALKAARIEARVKLAEVVSGDDPSKKRQAEQEARTVAHLCDYFLTVYAPSQKLSKAYVRDCRGLMTLIILPRLGKMKVGAVTQENVRHLMIDVTRATPIRANRMLALLSKMFNLAVTQQLRADNPCKGIARNIENKRDDFFSMADLEALMAVLATQEDQEQADALRLLILTGARPSELLRAEWNQFDLEAGRWTKPATQTKQRRVHRVPLSEAAVEVVSRLKARQGASGVSSRWVFPSPDDPSKPRESFRKFWERVRAEAGLGKFRMYECRHTYATHMITRGVPLHMVGQLMGHSQPATTARYAHLSDEAGREATSHMAKVVAAAAQRKANASPPSIEEMRDKLREVIAREPADGEVTAIVDGGQGAPDVLLPR